MPTPTEMELVTVEGRELRVRWNSPRFKEWLAWCYVPGPNGLPNEGAGFEVRAESAEAAKAALMEKVRAHLGVA
ncbi:MAG: hypothetical protein ACO1SX_19210 [Actinomycetota bacterium]